MVSFRREVITKFWIYATTWVRRELRGIASNILEHSLSLAGSRLLRVRLLHLVWREVEGVLLIENRFPRQKLSHSLVQVLQTRLVGARKMNVFL